jgi:hypothetical protein
MTAPATERDTPEDARPGTRWRLGIDFDVFEAFRDTAGTRERTHLVVRWFGTFARGERDEG